MLLEVYAIRRSEGSITKMVLPAPENRYVFDTSNILIRQSKQFTDKAEIKTMQSDTYLVSENYDDLLSRIAKYDKLVVRVKK
jgi:homospermidine synthase